MEEIRFPKVVLNRVQEGKRKNNPGEAGEIWEGGTGNNAQTMKWIKRRI